MPLRKILNDKLQAEKKCMRQAILAQRDAMPPAARTRASVAILEKICALPHYAQARVVLTYMGFGSEIETQPLFERIIADAKIAVLPRVDRGTQSLKLHSVCGMSELLVGKWGIREPPADAPLVSIAAIDFVLMPGVAFDHFGNRLGYGRGYYDKLLSIADPALARVAAAFSCQIVPAVPVGPHDQKVDSVITENEIMLSTHER